MNMLCHLCNCCHLSQVSSDSARALYCKKTKHKIKNLELERVILEDRVESLAEERVSNVELVADITLSGHGSYEY